MKNQMTSSAQLTQSPFLDDRDGQMPIEQANPDAGGKYLIATINHSHAGFFAYVNFALNQIIYAEKHGLQPVVFFGKDSVDGPNAFYDSARGDNMWEYYFEPVARVSYSDIQNRLADPQDKLTRDDLVTLGSSELWRIHCREPDSVFVYPHNMYKNQNRYEPEWYAAQRAKARRIIQKYIQVKPHILEKVNDFERRYFANHRVIGIHMRGTDKGTAGSSERLMRVVPPREYFPLIDAYTEEHGACKIFVATDQQQFLNRVVDKYGDRVVSYQSIRTRGIRNPFEIADGNAYRKGEDVLIDCLLLSRCDHLLKCTSAVGEFAMYFNPELDCYDLNEQGESPKKLKAFSIRLKRKFYKKYLARKKLAYRRREGAA
jgi:Alpha-(1,6)-fucosyltransferase N- and catalytic domains